MESALQLAEKYKKVFFLKDDDVLRVRENAEAIQKSQEAAFAEFYAWMEYQTELRNVFTDRVIDTITSHEKDIWLDLAAARVDGEMVQRQMSLGRLMQELGVPFEAYLSAMIAFHEVIENVYMRRKVSTPELIRSFKKIAGIQICLIMDIYNEAINETLRDQHAALMEMSTPVAKLWNGILFLPLVGIMDSKRSQNVMIAMLQKIMEVQAKVFILDISGIAVLDTSVANHLIKITKSTRLMGCNCIVSGISPNVAQTLVELGVQTEEMHTKGNLQDALNEAFQLTGAKIVNIQG